MDENKGRKVASKLNIPLSGTLGVLIDSFDTGLLTASEVNTCLNNMQQSGRRISAMLVNMVRNYLNK